VKFSPALKWFVILLLPLSLGWKLAAHQDYTDDLTGKVTTFLTRYDFNVVVHEIKMPGMPYILATRGGCRMLVAKPSYRGSDIDMIRTSALPTDRVFVVFGGKVYTDQPTWLTVPDYLWSKLLRELGFKPNPTSLIAVTAGKSCDAERLPWSELL
jgi:hypothetical protein